MSDEPRIKLFPQTTAVHHVGGITRHEALTQAIFDRVQNPNVEYVEFAAGGAVLFALRWNGREWVTA